MLCTLLHNYYKDNLINSIHAGVAIKLSVDNLHQCAIYNNMYLIFYRNLLVVCSAFHVIQSSDNRAGSNVVPFFLHLDVCQTKSCRTDGTSIYGIY